MEHKSCQNCQQAGSCRAKESTRIPPHELSEIKHVIGVMSGKGGVGKSSLTALLAVALQRKGYNVGIMDADITGPSIPKMFGLRQPPENIGQGLIPPQTPEGIRIMSLNLLLPHENDPVVWRGPLISGAIQQFWTDVIWGKLDYLLVDLPPGTADAPLTVLQSLPVDGLILVSSPQELVQMVVKKAMKMASLMGVKVLGLVENMSYITCPHCGRNLFPYGPSQAEEVAEEAGIPLLGVLPVDPLLAAACDRGEMALYNGPLMEIMDRILEHLPK